MLGSEFQIQRCIRQIAQDGAGGGVFARAASVKQSIADHVAADKDGIEHVVHTRQDVLVRNQRGIHPHLHP